MTDAGMFFWQLQGMNKIRDNKIWGLIEILILLNAKNFRNAKKSNFEALDIYYFEIIFFLMLF